MNLENMQANAFDVLAVGASAGGHAAITAVLQQLPPDFSVPILVIQHLAADSTTTDEFYRRLVPFPVAWVQRDSVLTPGLVLLCPPRFFVDLLPDGSFVFSPNEQGTTNKPIDHLFESVARSFGPHAIGVILTGMGADGALGARALHLAGGRVLVQSEVSAEFPDMPKAAIAAGAADLVAPVEDLGQVIGALAAGAARPQPRSEIEAIRHTFGEKSAVAAQAREIDWSSHPLGPVHRWPTQLREFVRMAVEYMDPAQLIWGEDQLVFFNDAAIPSYGSHWTSAFARPFREAFPDVAEAGAVHARVMAGEHVRLEGRRFAHVRSGQVKDAWFDVVHNPVYGPTGKVLGSFNVWYERTQAVLAARRLHAINQLATAPAAANRRAALGATLALLGESADVSFAAAYLVDEARRQALLGGAFGVEAGGALAPQQVLIRTQEEPWPLATVVSEGKTVVVKGLAAQFHGRPALPDRLIPGPGIKPPLEPVFNPILEAALDTAAGTVPDTAVIHPLRDEVENRVIGALVLGTNPRLLLDDDYRAFLTLAAETIEAKVAESHAQERERERLTQMAELDRAKTDFFANVSHEFRTPITLMLAPLEDLLRQGEAMPPRLITEVEVATANARRLLRLVNSLLDFSQIDARRQQPNFEPLDLCAVTTDIASAFRSAVEAAGLRFRVECDPNLPPVWLDREMWEKIVSNLLSNAFKFTFEGEIAVEVRALSLHAELTVRDTGIGIPEQELPNLFKRFHRVHGAKARTVEGAGIGLAIVEELVKRMGGQLTVRSKEHQGSSFTIWIPYKTVRIRGDAAALPAPGASSLVPGNLVAAELAKDASRWLAVGGTSPHGVIEDLLGPLPAVEEARRSRLLVADDNADLRAYLQRLLSPRWEIELAADGETALAAARRLRPHAILADVMMPGMDGFELIQRVRADDELQHTLVILLTARTDEDAAIQGLLAGADDYIAKPFSPRELIARIQAAVDRARTEEALRLSEGKYRALFEKMDDGFGVAEIIVDGAGRPVDYRMLEINPQFERLTGQQRAKFLTGHTVREIAPKLEEEWYDFYGQVGITGRPAHRQIYAAAWNRWFEVKAYRTGEPAQRRVAILYSEITERKLAEQALQESEERMQLAMRSTQMVTWEWLPSTDRITLSDSFAAVYGLPTLAGAEEGFALVLPEDKAAHIAKVQRIGAEGGSYTSEFRIKRPDNGRTVWLEERAEAQLDADAKVARVIGVTFDITERKRAEEALRESEEKYRTLFNSIDEGFQIYEVLYNDNGKPYDFRYLETNLAFERQTGLKNVAGKLGSEVMPNLESYWFDYFDNVLESPEPLHAENYNEATGRWYSVSSFRATNDGRPIIGALFKDITERKAREERQAFLLKVSDALRAEPNADAVADRAIRMLSEQMQLDRSYIVSYRLKEDSADLIHQVGNDTVPPLPDVFILSDYPAAFRATFDQTLVIEDELERQGLSEAERRNSGKLGMRAMVAATLRKGENKPLWSMVAISSRPRHWTPGEIALVEEVAERTWAAVERARVEAALREAEENYRAELEEEIRQRTGELRQAEELLQATLDSSPYIVQAFQAVRDDGGRIVDFVWVYNNQAGVTQNGDVIGKSLLQQNPGVVATGLFAKFVEVTETGAFYDHEQFYNHEQFDGWFHQTLVKMGDGFVMNTEDITPRKKAEQEILRLKDELAQTAETKYRSLFEEMSEGFALCELVRDAQGRPVDYLYLEVNQALGRHSGGLTEHDIVGKRATEAFPNLDRWLIDFYGRVVDTQQSLQVEHYFPHMQRWYRLDAFPREDDRFAVLFSDFSERKRAEEALRQVNETLEEQVRVRTEQVRTLVTQLTISEQEERRRISAILHDDLQQRLFSVNMQLVMLGQLLGEQGPDEARQVIEETSAALRESVQVMRSLSASLSPPVLHDEGLYEAVRWLASLMHQQYGLAVQVEAEHPVPPLDDDLRVLLFQLVRELLFNVVKHAGATEAAVVLALEDGQLRIAVSDAGHGFDPSVAPAQVTSQGLLRAEQKLQLLGGRLEITSAPGQGMRVAIYVPLRERRGNQG